MMGEPPNARVALAESLATTLLVIWIRDGQSSPKGKYQQKNGNAPDELEDVVA